MKELSDYMDIPQLIVKDLQGELSEYERNRLGEWLMEQHENQELYEKLSSKKNGREREIIIRKLNKKAAWNRINRKTAKKQRRIVLSVIKYAAVFMGPVFAILFAFYVSREDAPSQISSTREMEIKPGERKAELILAGGKRILLGADQRDTLINEVGIDIIQEKNGISYQGQDSLTSLVYNILNVPRGGEFRIKLQDGTMVYLNSETKLRYPVHFVGKERRVYLSGEAYFEVEHDGEKPFVVEMDESEIKVLGTHFNVRSYQDEDQQLTTLVSGRVLLTSKNHKSVELFPEEQGWVSKEGNVGKEKVDVYPCLAWKEGNFVFRRQCLENIMRIVERWYDVKIVFMDDLCKQVSFTGSVRRYDGFDKLIEMLEMTGSVKFEIKENVIYITKS